MLRNPNMFYKVKDRKSFSLYKSLLYGMPCACLCVQVGNINGERKECYQPIKHIHGLNRPYLTSLPQSLALQIYCVAVLGLVVQYSYRNYLLVLRFQRELLSLPVDPLLYRYSFQMIAIECNH